MGNKLHKFQQRAMQKAAAGIRLMSNEQQQKFIANNLHLIPPKKRRELIEDVVRKEYRLMAKKGKTIEEAIAVDDWGPEVKKVAGIDTDILKIWAEEEGCRDV